MVGLLRQDVEWSDLGMPYYRLSGAAFCHLLELGAMPITDEEANSLEDFWKCRVNASLDRLMQPRPYLPARLANAKAAAII